LAWDFLLKTMEKEEESQLVEQQVFFAFSYDAWFWKLQEQA